MRVAKGLEGERATLCLGSRGKEGAGRRVGGEASTLSISPRMPSSECSPNPELGDARPQQQPLCEPFGAHTLTATHQQQWVPLQCISLPTPPLPPLYLSPPQDVDPLATLPKLKYLSLLDNAITKKPDYRWATAAAPYRLVLLLYILVACGFIYVRIRDMRIY
jgi:hypothetical protein